MKIFLQTYLHKKGWKMLMECVLCALGGAVLGLVLQSKTPWVLMICAAATDALLQVRRLGDAYRAESEAQENDAADI